MMICTHPGCGVALPVNPRRKGTMCRRHASAALARDPARNAKIAQAVRAIHAVPGVTRARSLKIQATIRERLDNEAELRRQYEESGRRIGAIYGGRNIDADTRARATAKSRATRLAHIPVEYRDEYMALERKTGALAAERVAIIRDQIEADRAKHKRTGELPVASRKD